jgi:hypothetical protein
VISRTLVSDNILRVFLWPFQVSIWKGFVCQIENLIHLAIGLCAKI